MSEQLAQLEKKGSSGGKLLNTTLYYRVMYAAISRSAIICENYKTLHINISWGSSYSIKVFADDNSTVITSHNAASGFDVDVSNYDVVYIGGATSSSVGDITFVFTA